MSSTTPAAAGATPTQAMAYGPSLSLAEAKAVVAAAEAEALANRWTVVIAVLDAGGHLVLLERLDGTQHASCTIAQEKARSALGFKRPTKLFQEQVAAGGVGLLGLPGIVPFAGGLPLTAGGRIVGAIGVSGVQSLQDHQVAEAGARALAGGA